MDADGRNRREVNLKGRVYSLGGGLDWHTMPE
jgi:hypothetical protein